MKSRKILMMEKDNKIWIFQMEDEEIVEIHCENKPVSSKAPPVLGNIYIGKVKNIVSNIGAAFIEIGKGLECYYDLSQAPHAIFTNKIGKKPLCIGDELVVQITKEAVKTKVPTVSSNLSFTGKYAVLTSGNTRIGTSGKLPKSMKEEWKTRLCDLKNDDYGIIIRTNAKDAEVSSVLKELSDLKEEYEKIKEIASMRTCFSCLKKALPMYITDLKNVYTEGLTEIIIDGDELYQQTYSYFEKEQPEDLDKLVRYDSKGYDLPLSKLYNTDKVLERALSERVWLKTGGYLIIQYTEALTVIDVNSGKSVSKKNPLESHLKVNLEAAKEVAKQLRLRNLSGIILIDFINLDNEEASNTLMKTLKQELLKDPIHATLVDVTALQLVEVTRKKVKRPLYESIKA